MRRLKIGQRKRPRNGSGSRPYERHGGPRSIWSRPSASKRRLATATSWPPRRPASHPNATRCSPRPAKRRLESRLAARRTSTRPLNSSSPVFEVPCVLRPERMARALIVGPREKLESVIGTLYDMKLIHLVDHEGEDDTFGIGKPLPPAAELSDSLLKIRSIANILAVKAPPEEIEAVRLDQLRERILSLELSITDEDAARKKAESLLGDLDRRIEELEPFAALGLPLSAYQGYETVAVVVGRVAREISEVDLGDIPAEIFQASGIVAVFTTKDSLDL